MDGIDMAPGSTTDAMSLMAAAGTHMGTSWGGITTELSGLVGRLGGGELGAAFLEGYQQLASETGRAVDHCCRQPGQFAELGNQCVDTYVTADDVSRDHIDATTTSSLA